MSVAEDGWLGWEPSLLSLFASHDLLTLFFLTRLTFLFIVSSDVVE